MLEANHISVTYGAHRALEDVSVRVAEGEICVILGANGAGKSTFLKAIGGMVHAANGAEISIDGESLTGLAANRIVERGAALVPEGRGIFPDLTVAENLDLGAYGKQARAERDAQYDKVLKLFPKLAERLQQVARTMSGGEQQMVAIGRALMSNPKILMLDEPSLGLSPLLCTELFRSLKDVRDTGVGILLVEQNAKQSLAIADRAYLLENGHITGEGRAREMANDPAVQKAYLGGVANDGAYLRLGEAQARRVVPVAPRPKNAETASELATRAGEIQRAHVEALRHGGRHNGTKSPVAIKLKPSGEPIVMSKQVDELTQQAAAMAERASTISAAHVLAEREAAIATLKTDGIPKKSKKKNKAKKAEKKSKKHKKSKKRNKK